MSQMAQRLSHLTLEEKRELLKRMARQKARKSKTEMPLSEGQKALWVLHQRAPESAAYHIAFPLRLHNKIDLPALRRAFQGLINRHPALRTTFKFTGIRALHEGQAEPVQVIHGYRDLEIEVIDAFNWDEEQLQEAVRRAYQRPFDLEDGPVLRLHLFTQAASKHVLLLNVHHIAFDFWSLGILLEELRVLYSTGRKGGRGSRLRSLPRLTHDYSHYMRWQADMLSREGERLAAYWQQQLGGALPILNLPTDYARPLVQRYEGASQLFEISQRLIPKLKELATASGTTLYTLLLSVFQVLLYRYTGQEDILVGSPTSGRNQPELTGIVGYLVNPVVLRANFAGNPTFNAFVQQMRQTVLDAMAHQEYPFPLLVKQLQGLGERDPSRSALFQASFALQSPQGATAALFTPDHAQTEGMISGQVQWGGLLFSSFQMGQQEGQFDLSLEFIAGKQSLFGSLKYDTALFEATTIERMVRHLQMLLEGIVANPEARVADLPLLTAAERHQLLVEWNDTQRAYPQDQCIHERFEQQVERTPDAIALVCPPTSLPELGGIEGGQGALTYRELNERANQLAHYLMAQGVGAETLVGICVERSLEMVIGLYGILKAGGAYVPIDPTYPAERLAFMLQDSQTPLLLTQASLVERLSAVDTPLICLDSDWESIAHYDTHNPSRRVTPNNLAYCIYTSGSTGKPKGAMNNHHGIYNRLLWMQEAYQLTESDHILQKTPFSFDVSVWEFFWPLMFGARLVVARPEGHKDPAYLVEIIAQEEITTLHFVPSMLQLFLEAEELERLRSLRRVICSGEALPLPLTQRFFERIPANPSRLPQLHNLYGPTEAAIDVTYWECKPDSAIVPIGRPVANTQLYILDPFMQPVPIGVAGELHLGGVQVGRGYLNRPELSQQKFIPNPFGREKLYKTGDSCRYLPDGNVEFLGRIDFQVKIRGFRIELGEIEAQLSGLPAVREVVVVVRSSVSSGSGTGVKRLVAYLVGSESLNVSRLRMALAENLPDYMVPAAFVQLEEMPLTPNGKINRRALPAPDYRAEKETLVLPRTPSEELLAMIWQEVLDIEQVGIHDNFFELGGDSILAIRIVAKAKQMGMQFSLPQLFQHRTIYELARLGQHEVVEYQKTEPFALISEEERQELRQACAGGQLPPLAQLEDAYPLTMLQGGMLFHSELAPDKAIYHDIFTYHLRAPFDEALLLSASQWLAARHPVLRTSLHLTEAGEWLQVVRKTIPIPKASLPAEGHAVALAVEDIRHLAPDEQERHLAAWVAADKKEPFHWARPPLWRFQVHRESDESFTLTLSFHHLILDGWSVGTMITEYLQHYSHLLSQGISQGTRAQSLPLAPAIAFRDFVALEQKTLASEEMQLYWTQKLNDFTVLRLPRWSTAYDAKVPDPLPTLSGTEGEREQEEYEWLAHNIELPLSAELSADLKKLAQKAGVPVKSVLLAAHLNVLRVLGNQADVLTGLISNGRLEEVDGERVLGLFLNTLPFRLSLTGGSWLALAQETFKAEQEGLAYRRYPYAELQRKFGGEPLFEAAFNFTHLHIYGSLLEESQAVEIIGGRFFEKSNFTLTANFRLHPVTSQVELTLEYDQHQLSFAQIKTIGGYYARTLQAMVEPNAQYEQHSLLSPQERQRLLLDWNQTEVLSINPCSTSRGSHQLFEEQAARTPEAIALVFAGMGSKADERLTYGELNARANQLAHYLLRQGLKSEMLVGLAMERSLEMVIGLLAVFKAGGAYLPLDPTYPQERLDFMIEDSSIRLLLTQSELKERFSEQEVEHGFIEIKGERVQTICLDSDWPLIAKESPAKSENPVRGVKDNHLAYCIYTSGSTGKPKGVLVEHRGLCNLAHSQIRAFGVEADSRVLQFASLSFDASISEIMMALGKGASLYLASRDDLLPGLPLTELLNKLAITHITLPPTALTVMEPSDLPHLQTLIVAGEACSAELAAKWMPGRTFLNAYGPSEYSVCISIANISRDGMQHSLTPPIGRPIQNTQVYLLDPHLQPVPMGVPGELHVSGAGLARGYLNRPELTEQKFIAIPAPLQFPPTLGGKSENLPPRIGGERGGAAGRLYKTGDLCRYLPDGKLEFLGRLDHQVKLRGFRIELGEIEAVLRREPRVEEAVVVVHEEPTALSLVAYIVASEPLHQAHLRAYLAEKLPNYMIPSIFMQLEQMPLTPSRKIDRHALPAPDHESQAGKERTLPRTPTEQQLADIWQRVLGRTQIGIHQNFFEVGGHSLVAVSLMSQIQQTFGQTLPLSTLFQHGSIEELAALLRGGDKAEVDTSPLVAIQAGGSKVPFFCVHGGGGNVINYYDLARHLGVEQPFYGLQAVGLDGKQEPLTQVEEMASRYIKAMQTIQPQGPYQLGGWSFGGIIAFEMGQQLLASGQEIALVALIDSQAPIPINIEQMKLRHEEQTYLNYMKRLHTSPAKSEKAEEPLQWDHFTRIFKANSDAMYGYSPQFYASPLTLFRASEQAQESLPLYGWAELAAQVESYQIPGEHYTLIQEPYVQSLAAQLAASLL